MFHCVTISVTNRGCCHGLVESQIGPSRGALKSALEAPSEAPKIGQIRPQFWPPGGTQWDLVEAMCLSRRKFFFRTELKTKGGQLPKKFSEQILKRLRYLE